MSTATSPNAATTCEPGADRDGRRDDRRDERDAEPDGHRAISP